MSKVLDTSDRAAALGFDMFYPKGREGGYIFKGREMELSVPNLASAAKFFDTIERLDFLENLSLENSPNVAKSSSADATINNAPVRKMKV